MMTHPWIAAGAGAAAALLVLAFLRWLARRSWTLESLPPVNLCPSRFSLRQEPLPANLLRKETPVVTIILHPSGRPQPGWNILEGKDGQTYVDYRALNHWVTADLSQGYGRKNLGSVPGAKRALKRFLECQGVTGEVLVYQVRVKVKR